MKRTIICLLLAVCMAMGLTGCGGVLFSGGQESESHEYSVGDDVETMFFDLTVDSAAAVESAFGCAPTAGNMLVDVCVTITNTFGDDLPMGTFDFQIQWGDGDEDYGWPVEGYTDPALMPSEYTLAGGETVTYHMLFEVPAGSEQACIAYGDYYTTEDGEEGVGDYYFVFFPLASAR